MPLSNKFLRSLTFTLVLAVIGGAIACSGGGGGGTVSLQGAGATFPYPLYL